MAFWRSLERYLALRFERISSSDGMDTPAKRATMLRSMWVAKTSVSIGTRLGSISSYMSDIMSGRERSTPCFVEAESDVVPVFIMRCTA